MMNLDVVYSRVTGFFLDYPRPDLAARPLPVEGRKPLEWEEAQSIASRRMAEQAKALNFTIERPIALYHLREKGVFNYRVRSSLDIGEKYGATGIDIDIYAGELLNVSLPTGGHSGVTVSTWLAALHSANVFGPAYQIAVGLFGVTVAALSASGVYIWWKKRLARGALHAPRAKRQRSTMSDVKPS